MIRTTTGLLIASVVMAIMVVIMVSALLPGADYKIMVIADATIIGVILMTTVILMLSPTCDKDIATVAAQSAEISHKAEASSVILLPLMSTSILHV